jgi:hypothetical protein
MLSDHGLLVLGCLLAQNDSWEDLIDGIERYPEDVHREGQIRKEILDYVCQFKDLNALRDSLDEELRHRGGIETLEMERELYNFDEFLNGWEE